jgi:hypothetical protein
MTSWYSISMSIQGVGGIFDGYFTVDNNLVTSFYETINGSTDFNNNIRANNNYFAADYLFQNNKFSGDGTNITYMNYYSNPTSPGYNSTYAFFNIWFDYLPDFNRYFITTLLSDGEPDAEIEVNITTQSIPDPTCFNEGTKILCLNNKLEEYVPIEQLNVGDLVKSYNHGYRKIELIGKNVMINNPTIWNNCMYKMIKTDTNGLIEDLIITGGHSILVDTIDDSEKEENTKRFGKPMQIDDKHLLLASVSKDFVKVEDINFYTYYHFALENNGNDDKQFGVWANGILTETSSKNHFINHKFL